jgi:hypothetical protein
LKKNLFVVIAGFEDVDLGLRLSKVGKVKLIKNVFTIASLRRFEREGYLKWSLIWLATGLYYLFTKKSPLKHYQKRRKIYKKHSIKYKTAKL